MDPSMNNPRVSQGSTVYLNTMGGQRGWKRKRKRKGKPWEQILEPKLEGGGGGEWAQRGRVSPSGPPKL